ncbi:MAG: histidine kinase [Candidatus Eremiobacteraeota bacterium]|nr:histidine kinase [Candidatus Eremiobacteraeota bacterium]
MKLNARTTWLLIFAGFTLLACLNTAHYYLDDLTRNHPGTFMQRVVEEFTGAYGAFVLLPMIIWFERRFCFGSNWVEAVGGNAVGALLYSGLHTTIMWGSRIAVYWVLGLGWYDYGNMYWRYPMELAGDVFDYSLLLGLIALFDYIAARRKMEVKEAELEAKLSEAKLENLRLQLQPHFLFNTLNAISSVMYEDVRKADQMLSQVSEFMRLVLASGGVQSVTVDEELRIERMYVDIMKTRLERNLMLDIRVDDSAHKALVPFMVLQPLLENSIRHGMGTTRTSIDLEIDVSRNNGSTVIHVSDDGVGYGGGPAGIGLSNIISRLDYMYGNRATFAIDARNDGGTLATLTLPYIEGDSA